MPPRDPSLTNVPVRDLKGNAGAQMYSDKYVKETREAFAPSTAKSKKTQNALGVVAQAIDAVEAVNTAAKKGEKAPNAEKALQTAKTKMGVLMGKKNLSVKDLKAVKGNQR